VHIESSGRIIEVCGTDGRTLSSRGLEREENDPPADGRCGAILTEAFFGLVAVNGELWGSGVDAVYHIGADRVAHRFSLPEFHDFGCLRANFDLPGVVLISKGVEVRVSMSCDFPLLVAR
jgi:hypothetical protein